MRIGTFTEQDVHLLKKSNCRSVIIGIESGNEHIRIHVLRKKIGSNEDIIKGFKLFQACGISTASQNMIGVPEETFDTFYDTVRINAYIMPNKASMSVFYPYPGTNLYDKVLADHLLPDNHMYDPQILERKESLLKLPGFSKKIDRILCTEFQIYAPY